MAIYLNRDFIRSSLKVELRSSLRNTNKEMYFFPSLPYINIGSLD